VPLPVRFPIPLSIRTCGFPAYGLPMILLTWLRSFRIADGAHELVQALVMEPGRCPSFDLTSPQVTTPLLDKKPFEFSWSSRGGSELFAAVS